MKPDLSPEDLDGLLLNARRQEEDARIDENDTPPMNGAGRFLLVGFLLAVVIAVALAGWSLAK